MYIHFICECVAISSLRSSVVLRLKHCKSFEIQYLFSSHTSILNLIYKARPNFILSTDLLLSEVIFMKLSNYIN